MGWLYDYLRLKINHYIIIDNFFPDEICQKLRYKTLNSDHYHTTYFDYKALDFDSPQVESETLKDIADKYVAPKISLVKASHYDRSWSFVYNNIARGVMPHADPSFINVNIWMTPDECVHDHDKNGLVIYRRKSLESWDWIDYNGNKNNIGVFLKDSKYDIIPYKYNRAIIFRGNTFHSTNSVHMKNGDQNRRVNYTFLYT